jgi:flagellar assembly protein FliH
MASKLHRQDLATSDAADWSPLSKTGAHPVQNVRQAQDGDARGGDLERLLNEQVKAAYQRGLQEGEAGGRQQAAVQIQASLERLARTVEEIASIRPRLRHDAEEDVVKLALAIARRILCRELSTDPAALLGLVRAALDKLDGRGLHRIRANPQDAAALQQHFQQVTTPYKIEVFPDPALERGAAVFETEHGSLDASVDTQLNEIERGFADLVRRSK